MRGCRDRKAAHRRRPVGDGRREALAEVGPVLAASLDAKAVLAPGIALSASAFNARRRQYHSTQILETLACTKQRDWERILGVVDVDCGVFLNTRDIPAACFGG